MKRFLLGLLAHAATVMVTFAAVVWWFGCGAADLDVSSFAIRMHGAPNDRKGVFIGHGMFAIVGDSNTAIQMSILETDDGSPLIRFCDKSGTNKTLYVHDWQKNRIRDGAL